MKKAAVLSLVLGLVSIVQSQAQNFLIDLYAQQEYAYTGDALADFGLAGPIVYVGASRPHDGSNLYILGTTASLGMWDLGPYSDFANKINSTGPDAYAMDDPRRLTQGYLYASGASASGQFPILNIAEDSIITIKALGAQIDSDRGGILTLTQGTTTLGSGTFSNANADGTGTFSDITSFTALAGTTYTLTLTVPEGRSETNLSALYISITPVPEPSATVFIGAGLLAFLGVRRLRKTAATTPSV